ncbi:hypothetical protein LAZ67_5001097 [Cordylochernes scorpioides]|uniref:Mos1 transposase HTH domain-containing protein n=1 Tax=Cordylochernes scorpioides TaxID=51811 RepID=A0ABY6KF99_9ARAC|nr:hypothetical protein LAZ67_5001097 [Cordylochernes scorpioides]
MRNLVKVYREHLFLMKQVYVKLCLSKSNALIWHMLFLVQINKLDDKHTGRPNSSMTPELRVFVANNRCASLRMMSELLDINKETIRPFHIRIWAKKKRRWNTGHGAQGYNDHRSDPGERPRVDDWRPERQEWIEDRGPFYRRATRRGHRKTAGELQDIRGPYLRGPQN